MAMNDKEIINLINIKCVDIHNKCNNAVEEILRKGKGKENTEIMIESIKYTLDEIDRIINR